MRSERSGPDQTEPNQTEPPRALASAVADLGTVEATLEFETLRVRVPHERVGAVCELDGVATVQTDDALAMGADGAGEDVRFDEG